MKRPPLDQEVLSSIKNLRIFAGVSSAALDFIAQHGALKSFQKSDEVWQAGDPALFFGLILRGCVTVIRFNDEGLERTTGIFGNGDIIGVSAFLRKAPFPANARVESADTRVVKFYLNLEPLKPDDPLRTELNYWLREMLLLHEKILMEKIDIMSGRNLETKLYKLILHLMARFGIRTNTERDFIPIHISKTQMANFVEARVESTIRALNEWEKNGWIEMKHEGIFVPNIKNIEAHVLSV